MSSDAPSRAPRARIGVLPPGVAAKIAAGEVIERPSSVVKELVENALDADARRITVELEEGGVRLIRVSDDGHGIAAAEAPLAFTRHATSKLRDERDLDRIATLGFRGEALPSIAAVASVELVTRAGDAPTGVRVALEGGVITDVHEVGAAPGTTVTVRELFGPVPARRKFLRSMTTELGHVLELVARLALAIPEVHFRVLHRGREAASHPPVATLEARARQVFGAERVRGGRAFTDARLGLSVRGFLFSPHVSFASARYVHAYVNGRAVRDRGLHHAVIEGYASLIPRGRWPGAVVLLDLPPGDVDVNVHPAKHEVRFRLGHVVHDTVLGAVRRALAGATGLDGVGVPTADRVAEAVTAWSTRAARGTVLPFPRREAPAAAHVPRAPAADGREGVAAAGGVPEPGPTPVPPDAPATGYAGLRFVGQVFRGYLVCEGVDRLVLVDQHAAHERVAFERLRAQHQGGAVERQQLLLPVTVELAPAQAEALQAADETLRALGFEVEPFGERTALVRAVPALLGGDDPGLLVEDLADGLGEVGSHLSTAEAFESVLGRLACHSVVRVGRTLGPAEVARLLADLDGLAYGSNCPHGRPVAVEFTRGQLERMFGR